jgi:hypothetical protein
LRRYSTDETVYELLVPIDKPEIMTQALKMMSEFTTKIRISDADVEAERGSVLEEMRMGRDARGRASEAGPHTPFPSLVTSTSVVLSLKPPQCYLEGAYVQLTRELA